ncbi:hypothetical protein TNCV_4090011 [Trichonephila clavipes]|uniref:Uncharacterized protein n=1 Tax=Trichonephila clavipes TaxID=2585209 RepID=A0A8X6S4X8_TRICX|nr:hypothetical protein TNCV_4090011 [Trichonephila clavipes]
MSSPGSKPSPNGKAVSVANHFTGWATPICLQVFYDKCLSSIAHIYSFVQGRLRVWEPQAKAHDFNHNGELLSPSRFSRKIMIRIISIVKCYIRLYSPNNWKFSDDMSTGYS